MAQKLAIDGGTPVLKRSDYKNWPIVTQDDRKLINEVLDCGIFAGGTAPQVSAFEREWAEYTGAKYCLTTTSGTAALHMALAAAGVGPGDEVITSAFTFLASASCALHQNAIPVFVDIDPCTYCMEPDKLEAAINERTKAIIPGLHVSQPGTSRRTGSRATDAPRRTQRRSHCERELADTRVEQNPGRDPAAKELCDTYTIVHGIHAPNGTPLMSKFVEAFHRIFDNLGQVLAHADDPIYPGADARLYGAG